MKLSKSPRLNDPERWTHRTHKHKGNTHRDIDYVHSTKKTFPWLAIRPSAALSSINVHEDGLYAARPFEKGEVIGRMGGRVVGAKYDISPKWLVAFANENPYVIELYIGGRGPYIVDSGTDTTCMLHKANDGRKTPMQNNVSITPGGYMVATKHIPPLDRDTDRSEILWSYGAQYWKNDH
jgi:hypothetical protein